MYVLKRNTSKKCSRRSFCGICVNFADIFQVRIPAIRRSLLIQWFYINKNKKRKERKERMKIRNISTILLASMMFLTLIGFNSKSDMAKTAIISSEDNCVIRTRSGPSTDDNITGFVCPGEEFEVIDETDGWLQIKTEYGNAYIMSEYADITE